MNINVWTVRARRAGRFAATMGIACALLLASGSLALAGSARALPRNALVGTWAVRVTLRNCDTGASLGSFNSLVTFHFGGTVSESTSSPTFAIGQRGPGHGNWDFDGHGTYSQRMVSLITFDTPANLPGTPGFNPSLPVSPGFFTGWSAITHQVELTDADHGTSAGTNEFVKADGTTYRTGCSTATLTRFE